MIRLLTLSTAVTLIGTCRADAPSFVNHVIPMMTKVGCNSGACHGALAGKGGFKLSLRGYDPVSDHFVMTRQALGRRLDLVEPSQSLLLRKPTLAVPHGGGQKIQIGSPEFRILADWIAGGAPGPRSGEARIESLEVLPTHTVARPKQTLQIAVRGRYSDGHTEDVTHWCKFNSTEDLVATVDQEGKARVMGHGEAAITIWYSNRVATCLITSPFNTDIDARTFANAPRRNYVDDLVLKKLQTLHIAPSGLCTDEEFIRRVYLDATGSLPSSDDVRGFLADKSADKRTKLIDRAFETPQFIDYWSYKWSDLLLLSTRKLSRPSLWAFYQYVRASVARNKPWDRFAREILTANGSTLENGAANYFVLHKDVAELNEATSVTFMGMSITCARCHNHPLEKWTQDQYWSMANLFSRVAIKNGDRAGELFVQTLPSGDVVHPRRGRPMPPSPLEGEPLSTASAADRRQYFADWLTMPANPHFAKALVNRVWRNFMGRGLVEAEDDLRQTNPPTNSELFDALAKDFIDHGYDVQHLMRSIINSATYQRSSKPASGNATDDRFYSHYLVRRLSAEVMLDLYSQVTGVPTDFSIYFDERPVFKFPSGTRAQQLPDVQVASRFLDSFGRPDRTQTCSCERHQDSSITQALHLNNGQTLNEKIRSQNSRVEEWLREKLSDEAAIRRLFLLALCREPDAHELTQFAEIMASTAAKSAQRDVLEDLFWAVLTGKEFLFNH